MTINLVPMPGAERLAELKEEYAPGPASVTIIQYRCDDGDYVHNLDETFRGSWLELQDRIQQLKDAGYYDIIAESYDC